MPFSAEAARTRETQRLYRINVIGGCGHVGLPLAITFAGHGLKVSIYDINERAVETVRSGRMPFLEAGAEPLLRAGHRPDADVGQRPGARSRSRGSWSSSSARRSTST